MMLKTLLSNSWTVGIAVALLLSAATPAPGYAASSPPHVQQVNQTPPFQPQLARDINTGTAGRYISALTVAGPYVYYLSSPHTYETSLWWSDGTAEGTQAIPSTTWAASLYWAGVQPIGAIGNRLLFNAKTVRVENSSIWITNGQSATLVKAELTAAAVIHLNDVDYVLDGGRSGLWRFDPATNTISLAVAFGDLTSNHVVIGNWLYYLTDPIGNANTMRQLWRTDGTAANTQFIKTIPFGPYPVSEVVIDNVLYLRYDTSLWRSDGTLEGTELVSDALGGESEVQIPLTKIGKRFFFVGSIPDNGTELWVSDGTRSGTTLVRDIQPGPGSAFDLGIMIARAYKAVGNTFYFVANDGTTGSELWKSDGTAIGTQLVKDIAAFGDSAITNMTEFNGALYFSADDRIHGRQLWTSDGTESGTHMVLPLGVIGGISPNVSNLTVLGSQLLFSADTADYGNELWVTDGSATNTHLLKDSGQNGANSDPTFLTSSVGKLFFVVNSYSQAHEIWASDGSPTHTELIRTLDANALLDQTYGYLGELNHYAYFHTRKNMNSATDAVDIWRTDGTPTGTEVITSVMFNQIGYIYSPTTLNDKIYFSSAFVRLWRIDPSGNPSLQLITDTLKTGAFSWKTDAGIWLTANESTETPTELWRVSAATEQLERVHTFGLPDIYGERGFYWVRSFNNQTVFLLPNRDRVPVVWRSDGTPSGTISITALSQDDTGANVLVVAQTSDALYIVTEGVYGGFRGLWRTDGTVTGTQPITITSVFSPESGLSISNVNLLGVLPHKKMPLYNLGTFEGGVRSPKDWLMALDPATNTLSPLTDVDTLKDVDFRTSRVAGNLLYFVAAQNELWRTDGTPAGTKRVYKNNISQSYASIRIFGSIGSELIFSVYDSMGHSTLWSTHGDTITELFNTPELCNPINATNASILTMIDATLYFCGNTAATGNELWTLPLNNTTGTALNIPTLLPTPLTAITNTQYSLFVTLLGLDIHQSLSTTLTATLPVSVTYISDTSGLSPTLNGSTLIWQLLNLSFGQTQFTLNLDLPNPTLGAHYPITFTLADNTATTDLWLTTFTFLPMALR